MPRLRTSTAPRTEMMSRRNRHFAGYVAVIVGSMLVGSAATSAEADVVTTTTNVTTTDVLPDLLTGKYYQPGGIYIDFVDGTTSSAGAAPALTGSATTAPSWNVHLLSSQTSSTTTTSWAELPQIFAANGNAIGQYADIVSSTGTTVASLLTPGTVVGSSSAYGTNRRESIDTHKATSDTSNWMAGNSGYMGVEFLDASGALHYGWIAMTLGTTYPESITVTGFAYETTPGLAITIPNAVPEPASLGIAAVGAIALGVRRRRAR